MANPIGSTRLEPEHMSWMLNFEDGGDAEGVLVTINVVGDCGNDDVRNLQG